jgi:hypothetical protein
MNYQIRKAMYEDLPRIEEIYAYARKFMAENGNPNQWGTNTPPTHQLIDDIQKGDLYVLLHQDMIHGVFYFFIGPDPTYGEIEDGSWRSDTPYGTIHRIASDGSGGVLAAAVRLGKERINHIRIDTHEDNKIMQRGVAKFGFQRSGIINLENGSPRIAYDLLIEE